MQRNGHSNVQVAGDQCRCLTCGCMWDLNDTDVPICSPPQSMRRSPLPKPIKKGKYAITPGIYRRR